MKKSNSRIAVLEEKHSISILLYLLDNGPSMKSRIYKTVSTNPRMPEKLELLEEAGLISMKVDSFCGNRTDVDLTDFGKSVAKQLKIVEIMINEYLKHAEEHTETNKTDVL